jgi:hypothetical protein
MSRLRCAALDMTRATRPKKGIGMGLAATPPNPFLSPISNETYVIPSGANEVCEVEESPCYKGKKRAKKLHLYYDQSTQNNALYWSYK